MPRPPLVSVVGSLHFDIMVQAPYLPRTGETLIGDAWWWKPGGKGGNQAMAAARHGARVEMIGCLGDDGFGARLRERLVAAGVGIDGVHTVAQGSGMSVAIQQAGGDYAAIVVSGANHDIDGEQVTRSAEIIGDSQVLVLQNEVPPVANVAAARLARATGTTVVLNAAPARSLDDLVGLVDILVVNAIEAEMLGAGEVEGLEAGAEAALALRGLAPNVIVTLGAAGLAAASGRGTWTIPAHDVPRAESHAAGDTFVGALAARLAHGDELDTALRYANAAAALHVSTPEDTRDRIAPDDVRRLLAEAGA